MHALYLIVVCIRHGMTLLPAINLMILAYIYIEKHFQFYSPPSSWVE